MIDVNDLTYHGIKNANGKAQPRFLYHYTSFDSALKIFDAGKLMMRSLSNMNDPFEFLNRNHGVFYNGCPTGKELSSMVTKHTHAHAERSNGVRMAAFSVDNEDHKILHKGWNLFSNWTWYGQNHAGVCLVFDYEHLVNDFNSYFDNSSCKHEHGLITYAADFDTYEDMFGEPHESFTDETHIDHLFTKPDSYEREQEYRFLIVDAKMDNPNTPVFMPIKTSLCGVITGYKFPLSNKLTDGIITACNNLGYNLSWFYFDNTFGNPLRSYANDKELYKKCGIDNLC